VQEGARSRLLRSDDRQACDACAVARRAIEAQASALDSFYIDGIRHNIRSCRRLMLHPRCRRGAIFPPAFIAESSLGFAVRTPKARSPEGSLRRCRDRTMVLANATADIRPVTGLPGAARAAARYGWSATKIALDIARDADGSRRALYRCRRHACIRIIWSRHGRRAIRSGRYLDGQLVAMQVRPIANGFRLAIRAMRSRSCLHRIRGHGGAVDADQTVADTGKKLAVPECGARVSIAVAEGQEVKAGETLAVVEAMKMQNVLRAERDGTVQEDTRPRRCHTGGRRD